jgi:hypothetical protein
MLCKQRGGFNDVTVNSEEKPAEIIYLSEVYYVISWHLLLELIFEKLRSNMAPSS